MKLIIILLSLLISLVGCSKKELEPTDDNELITTVQLEFIPLSNNPSQSRKSFYWRDIQGDGVMDSVDPIVLDKNTSYEMNVSLLDETKKPVFNISKEIEAESDVHLFVFKSNPLVLLNVQIKDLDKYGKPIGLRSEIKSQFVPGIGTFSVILKHQPPVNGKATKTGNEEGGSTDVDVTFPVSIK